MDDSLTLLTNKHQKEHLKYSNSKSCPNSTNEILEKENTMDDSVTLSETQNQTCDESTGNAKCKSSASCTTEERSNSSNPQTLTLKSQCKKKCKESTVDPIETCRQWKWTGPFNSPFDQATHRDYLLCNTVEYFKKDEFYMQPCLAISPTPKFENRANQLLLQVGDRIRNTNHINTQGVIGLIIEFKRGVVICSSNMWFCPTEEDFSIDFYHVF